LVLTDEERKVNHETSRKKYIASGKGKAKQEEYYQKNKEEILQQHNKWLQTIEGKASKQKYQSSPKGKKARKKFQASPKGKKVRKNYASTFNAKTLSKNIRDDARLKILKVYSKRLSNSNIPCCNCCGEKSYLEFLALDHIAGKKQMDSELELVKLEYSSKLKGLRLHKWIIKNDYPDGFQILCHNCNNAKGFYGKCPHEMK